VTELVPTTSRQQVLTQPDGSALIVITPEQAPAGALQLPITDPELAAYLEPNELTQSDSDAIRRLAEEIVGQERDAWHCAQLLLRWVHQNLRKLPSEPRPLSALEILQAGEGDCSEHAVLLAALAKAAGIPVRIVVGLVYVNGSYGYHEWNELFVGRWVQMDASWGRETVGAGHVELAKSASDRDAMLTSHLAIGRTIGTLFLKFDHSRNAE
jgi:transglutaminase-like putative cysteine protease